MIEQGKVLLPVPVRLELLSGVRSPADASVREELDALPSAMPGNQTWSRMEDWCLHAALVGQRFGFADLLIAALTAEAGAELWSFDRAFERMEKLGFIHCHRPPA